MTRPTDDNPKILTRDDARDIAREAYDSVLGPGAWAEDGPQFARGEIEESTPASLRRAWLTTSEQMLSTCDGRECDHSLEGGCPRPLIARRDRLMREASEQAAHRAEQRAALDAGHSRRNCEHRRDPHTWAECPGRRQ